MKHYKILFADLDGTLIKTKSGKTFPEGIWDMEFKFEVLDAIKALNPIYVCIVSNQGNIEKGLVNEIFFYSKIDYVSSVIYDYTNCETFYQFCTSNDENDYRRKPNTGMLEEFCYASNKEDCLMIGSDEDQSFDLNKKTAKNFGIDYMDVKDFVTECFKLQQQ